MLEPAALAVMMMIAAAAGVGLGVALARLGLRAYGVILMHVEDLKCVECLGPLPSVAGVVAVCESSYGRHFCSWECSQAAHRRRMEQLIEDGRRVLEEIGP